MKILSPIAGLEDVKALYELGATEFYCGYMPEYWLNSFNQNNSNEKIIHYQIGINKKDVNVANVETLDELRKIVNYVKERECELFITVNAAFYPELAYDLLDRYFKELTEISIENIIVNDLGLIYFLHKNFSNFKLTISCLSQVTNSEAVSFYKESFNIRRIVFPRHISCTEMIRIAKDFPSIEFEFFVLSGKCIYDDGFCRCHHDFGQLCTDTWDSSLYNYPEKRLPQNINLETARMDFRDWSQKMGRKNMGCSLCAIHSVKGINNICSVKIAGRGKPIDIKRHMVMLTKEVIEISEKKNDIEEIRNVVRRSFFSDVGICDENYYCYSRGI